MKIGIKTSMWEEKDWQPKMYQSIYTTISLVIILETMLIIGMFDKTWNNFAFMMGLVIIMRLGSGMYSYKIWQKKSDLEIPIPNKTEGDSNAKVPSSLVQGGTYGSTERRKYIQEVDSYGKRDGNKVKNTVQKAEKAL